MKRDLGYKINRILEHNHIDEDQTRSLIILVRKHMELMPDVDKADYATLNLFCNWSAHTIIDQSQPGLRTLSRINDVLVRVKDSTDVSQIQKRISEAIGFNVLRREFISFLGILGVKHRFSDKGVWAEFLSNIIEIIRDVPLSFPPIAKLKAPAVKIYAGIAKNPIKARAGVIRIMISKIDFDTLEAKGLGQKFCILIQTEAGPTIVVPLIIEV